MIGNIGKSTSVLSGVSPLSSGLLDRTKVFRDRAKTEGGEIEDKCLQGLYDPVLRSVKNWDLLPKLSFFGSASVIKNNSGSITKVFDSSGNEYDASQQHTSHQPTLDKNSIGGRWGINGDGDDDYFNLPAGVADTFESGSEGTVIVVVRYEYDTYYKNSFALDESYPYWLLRTDNSNNIVTFVADSSGGEAATGSTLTEATTLIHSGRYDGSKIVNRENGSQTASTNVSLGDSTYSDDEYLMGRSASGERIAGLFSCAIAFGVPLSNSQLSELEDKTNSYYNNIY